MSFLGDHLENLRATYRPDPVETSWAELEAVRRKFERSLTAVDMSEILEDCVIRIFDLSKEDRALEIGKVVLAARNAYLDRLVDRELEDA